LPATRYRPGYCWTPHGTVSCDTRTRVTHSAVAGKAGSYMSKCSALAGDGRARFAGAVAFANEAAVRTRYRGHPWPLPRHTRTSTSSACRCRLPRCRSRPCRRPRRGVVCRDAAACTGSPARPAPTNNEAAPSTYRWTSSGRGGWGKWHMDVPRPRVRTWMCARGVHHPPVGRRPRPKPAIKSAPATQDTKTKGAACAAPFG